MNIISYFIGGILHKVYIDFSISATLMVDESEKEKVMSEMSKLIVKFMKNKHVIKLENNFENSTDTDFLENMSEVGEA
jgi:hypothetical protein